MAKIAMCTKKLLSPKKRDMYTGSMCLRQILFRFMQINYSLYYRLKTSETEFLYPAMVDVLGMPVQSIKKGIKQLSLKHNKIGKYAVNVACKVEFINFLQKFVQISAFWFTVETYIKRNSANKKFANSSIQ